MTVTSHSKLPASDDESETPGKKCNRYFLHLK
jgi:hypothetical protein